MRWIDAHTHLDVQAFEHDRAAVVARAHQRGVTGFLISAGDPAC